MKKWILLVSAVFGLTACTKYASNAEKMYLRAHNAPMVNVPPPLTASHLSYFYVLPDPTGNPRVSIEPPLS